MELVVIAGALAGCAAAFVLAELVARFRLRSKFEYFVWRPWERTRMEIDAASLPMLERSTRFEINADGERGAALPADRRGLYRVLVAGGSAAEGYFLDQSSSWPGVLQARLNESQSLRELGAARVHVGNIARSLVPCEAIAHMLERVLPRYEKLDLVLFMVGASDVVAWLEQRCPAELTEGTIPLADIFDEHPEHRFGWRLHELALRQVASRLNRRLRAPEKLRRRAGAKLIELRKRRHDAREWIDRTPDARPMLARFEKYLKRLIAAAQAKGARVIVVRQPWFAKEFDAAEEGLMWNFCVGRPYVEPTTTYYTHRVVDELMRQVDACAARVADELGAEQLDLMPRLERSLATYYDYLHFTPTGARAVADEVTRAVLSRRSS